RRQVQHHGGRAGAPQSGCRPDGASHRAAHTRELAFAFVILRTWVAAAAAALALTASAQAGAPPVSARAFFVENPATGEVLAQRGAWARVPIASITKLMTVLVTLDHARWDDVVRVRSAATAVGESTVNLRAGERITVGDLVKA